MSTNSDTATQQEVTTSENSSNQYIGKVKWFNNKAGFGFVTALDGDKKNEDIFVHHSAIHVSNEQYKYLVQGEYVTFETQKSENAEHPYQASNVRGVYGNELMCETRWQTRQKSQDSSDDTRDNSRRNNRRPTRQRRNQNQRQSSGKQGEWSMENVV
tara:strand:+ start:303 stop:773 length:471 start_codon:yes stop_codon:yes gene_type:complete